MKQQSVWKAVVILLMWTLFVPPAFSDTQVCKSTVEFVQNPDGSWMEFRDNACRMEDSARVGQMGMGTISGPHVALQPGITRECTKINEQMTCSTAWRGDVFEHNCKETYIMSCKDTPAEDGISQRMNEGNFNMQCSVNLNNACRDSGNMGGTGSVDNCNININTTCISVPFPEDFQINARTVPTEHVPEIQYDPIECECNCTVDPILLDVSPITCNVTEITVPEIWCNVTDFEIDISPVECNVTVPDIYCEVHDFNCTVEPFDIDVSPVECNVTVPDIYCEVKDFNCTVDPIAVDVSPIECNVTTINVPEIWCNVTDITVCPVECDVDCNINCAVEPIIVPEFNCTVPPLDCSYCNPAPCTPCECECTTAPCECVSECVCKVEAPEKPKSSKKKPKRYGSQPKKSKKPYYRPSKKSKPYYGSSASKKKRFLSGSTDEPYYNGPINDDPYYGSYTSEDPYYDY